MKLAIIPIIFLVAIITTQYSFAIAWSNDTINVTAETESAPGIIGNMNDRDNATFWQPGGPTPSIIGATLINGSLWNVNETTILNFASPDYYCNNYTIDGSTDATSLTSGTWTTLTTITNNNDESDTRTFANNNSYKWYRINCSAYGGGANGWAVREVFFSGSNESTPVPPTPPTPTPSSSAALNFVIWMLIIGLMVGFIYPFAKGNDTAMKAIMIIIAVVAIAIIVTMLMLL